MKLRARLALRRLERRLRELQDAYYDADRGDEPLTTEYFRTLEEARTIYLDEHPRAHTHQHKIHLGSGDHRIQGWINVDLTPMMPVDVVADLARDMPFRSASIDLIHSEDFIEHVDREAGKRVLRECHRVLKRGGVMRLLTPDLRALVDEIYIRRDPRHLRWCGTYLDTTDPCDALNMHMRMGGDHRYIYDEEHLTTLLREIGFDVRRVRYNSSRVPHLRYLDLRNFGLNLFLEAVKR